MPGSMALLLTVAMDILVEQYPRLLSIADRSQQKFEIPFFLNSGIGEWRGRREPDYIALTVDIPYHHGDFLVPVKGNLGDSRPASHGRQRNHRRSPGDGRGHKG